MKQPARETKQVMNVSVCLVCVSHSVPSHNPIDKTDKNEYVSCVVPRSMGVIFFPGGLRVSKVFGKFSVLFS